MGSPNKGKESFIRLLHLVSDGELEATPELLREAQRRAGLGEVLPPLLQAGLDRGEIGGVVDIPFRMLCSIMEEARIEENLELAAAVSDYSRHMFRLWRSLLVVSENWKIAMEKGNQDWVTLVPKGKWHQVDSSVKVQIRQISVRCGTSSEGGKGIEGPTPLSKLQEELNSGGLCGRCLNEAKKNWGTIKSLERSKTEEAARRKLISWMKWSDLQIIYGR